MYIKCMYMYVYCEVLQLFPALKMAGHARWQTPYTCPHLPGAVKYNTIVVYLTNVQVHVSQHQ